MLSTISTLFRARVAEEEEALTERNAATLLAQHLRDAQSEIALRRKALAALMARLADLKRRTDQADQAIAEREAKASAVMARNETGLAADIADDILVREDRRAVIISEAANLEGQIDKARETFAQTEAHYNDLKDQLRQAKLREQMRGAVKTAATTGGEHPLNRAAEVARMLSERDQKQADLDQAEQELAAPSAPDLDARIAMADLNNERADRRRALLERISTEENK